MSNIAWGVDGHGRQWPWCEDCGKIFGPVRPCEIDHVCSRRNECQAPIIPDRIPIRMMAIVTLEDDKKGN